jgi:hypothetical protein
MLDTKYSSVEQLMLSATVVHRHFQEKYPTTKRSPDSPRTRPAWINRLFEFRAHQRLVEVDPSLSNPLRSRFDYSMYVSTSHLRFPPLTNRLDAYESPRARMVHPHFWR